MRITINTNIVIKVTRQMKKICLTVLLATSCVTSFAMNNEHDKLSVMRKNQQALRAIIVPFIQKSTEIPENDKQEFISRAEFLVPLLVAPQHYRRIVKDLFSDICK